MNWLLGLASPWGYVLVFLLAAGESAAFIGLFLPGEAAMILGGVLVYQGGAELPLMLVVGCVGAIVGDSAGYWIGRRFGPTLQKGPLGRRVGEERWERAAGYLRRRGGRAVFFGRFVGVLRALLPALAGSAGIPYRTFLPFSIAGGTIWVSVFITLGYLAGGELPPRREVGGSCQPRTAGPRRDHRALRPRRPLGRATPARAASPAR